MRKVKEIKCLVCNQIIIKKKFLNHILTYESIDNLDNINQALNNDIGIPKSYRNKIINKFSDKKLKNDFIQALLEWKYRDIIKHTNNIESNKLLRDTDKRIQLTKKFLEEVSKKNRIGYSEPKFVKSLNTKLNSFKILRSDIKKTQKNYEKIVFTWHDVKFFKNAIQIKPDKGLTNRVAISGSLNLLNEIKKPYFERVFKTKLFKVYVQNGIINEQISPDINWIRSFFKSNYSKNISAKRGDLKELLFGKQADFPKRSKSFITSRISNPDFNNKFLKISAKYLNEIDRIIPLIEYNNGKQEEALLFIYKEKEYDLILWENSNLKRAAYFFKTVKEKSNETISQLYKAISLELNNKRILFQSGKALTRFSIESTECYFIRHENEFDYEWKIKSFTKRQL